MLSGDPVSVDLPHGTNMPQKPATLGEGEVSPHHLKLWTHRLDYWLR
jgi:hypothetical protein